LSDAGICTENDCVMCRRGWELVDVACSCASHRRRFKNSRL